MGSGPHPKVYYFHVRGSAFLWHQIRHMVALLFLVGQGLEAPTLVSELLDVSKNPCRPGHAMANEVPLVLWDCVFPSSAIPQEPTMRLTDALEWVYVGDNQRSDKFGQHGLGRSKASASVRLFQGGDSARLGGRYTQVMKSKDFVQSPEEQNEKYAKRKGYASAADLREKKGIGRGKEAQTMADGSAPVCD
ncbi:Pseudouridine synthase I, TruA [Ophiocordyceps sinensis CO18]|uniref:tRNA pseudouridine synthase n=1 Tax=Ophiocordyceps sinensis (strain Co18 / CGMCC 3.14243) TaxID=911162 RepID=T4ZW83_OPHSC|nr:Pseudouridine synthase I, TruA [Ophiocordyceps sinensis CO18]